MILFFGEPPEDDPHIAVPLVATPILLTQYREELAALETMVTRLELEGGTESEEYIRTLWKATAVRAKIEIVQHRLKYVRN